VAVMDAADAIGVVANPCTLRVDELGVKISRHGACSPAGRNIPVRNLMGRLNARTDEELQRISIAWLLPGTARDRAALIAQLMRAMTDLRATRDFWMRRSHDEREMIALHVASDVDEGFTIAELAGQLGLDEAAARATATRLYQAGALATNARQQQLGIGEVPRLFLPRELGQLFARIQDELDAGDVSGASLSALFAMLDDTDVQRAAELWGLEAMPGLRTRRELTEGLLELVGYPDRRAAVERKLGWDAKRVLAKVTELPAGQTTPLAEVAESLELDPNQPRSAERLRNALTELEESLLVWHTFLPDGTRALFQPLWQAVVPEPLRDRESPPRPIESTPALDEPPHRYALAWDLLTLLRWLGAGTPAVAPLSSATVRSRRRFNALLWNRGAEEPIPGYLELLAALADHGNLLDPPDSETRVNPALRVWRSRSFADQTAQLLFWWLGSAVWIEALDQEDVVVSGAHWPQFRRRLMVLLPELDPGAWYGIDELSRWLSHRSSDALGDKVQIATSRPVDAHLDRSAERLSSLEQVVERTLRSGFAWFGLVDIAHIPSIGEVVRVTDAGLAAAGVCEPVAEPAEPEPALIVHPDLTITLSAPSPVRIWSLTAFADQLRLQPQAEYRITNRSLKRSLTAGFRVQDVITFLERQAGAPLEDGAREQLERWAETLGRVWMTPALIVQAEQEDETRALRSVLSAAGLMVTPAGESLLVQGDAGLSAAALERKVSTALEEEGKSPQLRAAPDTLASDERPEGLTFGS
jgi:hypothetical protein